MICQVVRISTIVHCFIFLLALVLFLLFANSIPAFLFNDIVQPISKHTQEDFPHRYKFIVYHKRFLASQWATRNRQCPNLILIFELQLKHSHIWNRFLKLASQPIRKIPYMHQNLQVLIVICRNEGGSIPLQVCSMFLWLYLIAFYTDPDFVTPNQLYHRISQQMMTGLRIPFL